MDYAFMADAKKSRDEDTTEERPMTTILTAIDIDTGMTMACVVQRKGITDYAVAEVQRFVLESFAPTWGCSGWGVNCAPASGTKSRYIEEARSRRHRFPIFVE